MVEVDSDSIEMILKEYVLTNEIIKRRHRELEGCTDPAGKAVLSNDYHKLLGQLLGIKFTLRTLNLAAAKQIQEANAKYGEWAKTALDMC